MRVLGVLAGNDMPVAQIEAWARSAEVVYAADGGANPLLQLGIVPETVIGDFDSLDSLEACAGVQCLRDPDQSSSDCDKLLRLVAAQGHSSITLVNSEGDFPDHFLATLQSACKSELDVRFAFRRGIGRVIKGPQQSALLSPLGSRLSLLPLTSCEGVDLTGVEWNLEDASLAPDGLSSLSNRTTASQVGFAIDSGSALLVLLHHELEAPHW